MLRVLTDVYNFEEGLAQRRLRDYCTELAITVGRAASQPLAEPRLVENLQAMSQANGVSLAWKLPATDCDGVRVIRSHTGPPKSPTDGREIASGRIASWIDTTAEPGRKYAYAVFSVLGGETSTRCVYCAVHYPPAYHPPAAPGPTRADEAAPPPCARAAERAELRTTDKHGIEPDEMRPASSLPGEEAEPVAPPTEEQVGEARAESDTFKKLLERVRPIPKRLRSDLFGRIIMLLVAALLGLILLVAALVGLILLVR
jgi:hypothetical protein